MSHTPTPWTVAADECSDTEWHVNAPMLVPVATCNYAGVPKLNKANADFIALAANAHDELVAALSYCRSAINTWIKTDGGTCDTNGTRISAQWQKDIEMDLIQSELQARAALAKLKK